MSLYYSILNKIHYNSPFAWRMNYYEIVGMADCLYKKVMESESQCWPFAQFLSWKNAGMLPGHS
ncbi:hypothetical protein SBA2_1270001 [Acidobacteriia bacterium SbA2]|nr:hypothetical protein SBA2_1270001 [Acidobacteriia bacterium SbA2]